jgi:tetratricopeptide (TPR) repeat protein
MPSLARKAAICLALAVLTISVFWQLKDHSFINYDDNLYITENLPVQAGLSSAGLLWAFETTATGNWHPLTWLSHMLDWQLYGANPGGHHLTSLILHVINTLLLFLIMARLTKRLWPSALVAALFALHPLHVESVAWASERKDVLSAFFWLLTMGAYLRYAESPGTWRYLPVTVCFALGLLAKPMAVTEPFVLLLLDYWPLGRWPDRPAAAAGKRQGQSSPSPQVRRTACRLVWEKAPLFALAAISCLITYKVQQGAMATVTALPLWARLGNALMSYVGYLVHLLWPLNLAVFYPYAANSLVWWKITGAALLLGGVTALAIRKARSIPYLPVGWFWYLGTLVPAIGLVQVGEQAMADRYTYIPLIGVFIILAFGAADLAAGQRRRQVALAVSGGLALLACLMLTWRQVGYWRDSATIFGRAVEVTENNYAAYNNLGLAYDETGQPDEAVAMFYRAIRSNPNYPGAYNNLGIDLADRGDVSAAIPMFLQAIRLQPNLDQAYNNLGEAYLRQGRVSEAREMFEMALKKNPGNLGAKEKLDSIRDR